MGNGTQSEKALRHPSTEERRMTGILITGAAKRIGRQLAIDLAAAGHDIAIHYNGSQSEAEEVAKIIRDMGQRAVLIQGDLADADIGDRLIKGAHAQLGTLDCLINNASIFEVDEVGQISLTSWQRHMDINLRAPIMLSQATCRRCPRQHHQHH
jgi:NAD(P)-dependent dehydrogenase (short-subunit alcohol dehydrogenase family)